jgi:hypothetical protein
MKIAVDRRAYWLFRGLVRVLEQREIEVGTLVRGQQQQQVYYLRRGGSRCDSYLDFPRPTVVAGLQLPQQSSPQFLCFWQRSVAATP